MCFHNSTGQLVEKQPSAKTSNTSTSSAAGFDWDGPQYQTNNFKIYEWKVTPCTHTEPHDTDKCPFAHPGEKSVRRDVRIYKYSPEACPATQQKNGKCPRGMDCPLSHTVFERWLHPQRFRTQMCANGPDCPRKSSCFFAHSEEELRHVAPDSSSSSSAASTLSLVPSAQRVSSINDGSSSASGSTISCGSLVMSPQLLQPGSRASCFSIRNCSSTPPSISTDTAAGAAAAQKVGSPYQCKRSNSSTLPGVESLPAGPAATHVLKKFPSTPDAVAGWRGPPLSSSSSSRSSSMGGSSNSRNLTATSPANGARRSSMAVAARAVASTPAVLLGQQLQHQQALMWQQEQHAHEQQQLQLLQAHMQQLHVSSGASLGSQPVAQHMQLLLEQEISNSMQQAAAASAAAEAANQRLSALRYAMHSPGLLPAAASGGYAPPAEAGAACFASSAPPIAYEGVCFSSPAAFEPLNHGLYHHSHHQQQQQQQLHFSPANGVTLPGMVGAAGSPALPPIAAACGAYGPCDYPPPELGFAGVDASNSTQALLAMLLSQMQGSVAAAAPVAAAGLQDTGPVCSTNTHFVMSSPCASQAEASALLAAAAGAQMMPASASAPGLGLSCYPQTSTGAAMQSQGACHNIFMP